MLRSCWWSLNSPLTIALTAFARVLSQSSCGRAHAVICHLGSNPPTKSITKQLEKVIGRQEQAILSCSQKGAAGTADLCNRKLLDPPLDRIATAISMQATILAMLYAPARYIWVTTDGTCRPTSCWLLIENTYRIAARATDMGSTYVQYCMFSTCAEV